MMQLPPFVVVTSTETAIDHDVDEIAILCKDDGKFLFLFCTLLQHEKYFLSFS